MLEHRWHWNEDLKQWGLLTDTRPFPSGLVFEEEGQAYWLPFGREVIGKQSVASIEEGKAALLAWLGREAPQAQPEEETE